MPKRTFLIAAGVTFGLWVILILAGVLIVFGGLENARVNHKSLRVSIEELQDKRDQEAAARLSYERLKPAVAKVDGALMREEDILPMLLQFESSARETGNAYEVSVASDGGAAGGKGSAEVLPGTVLNIKLSGSFRSLYEFIRKVEAIPYLLQFSRVNARLVETGGRAGLLETSLQIKVFTHP